MAIFSRLKKRLNSVKTASSQNYPQRNVLEAQHADQIVAAMLPLTPMQAGVTASLTAENLLNFAIAYASGELVFSEIQQEIINIQNTQGSQSSRLVFDQVQQKMTVDGQVVGRLVFDEITQKIIATEVTTDNRQIRDALDQVANVIETATVDVIRISEKLLDLEFFKAHLEQMQRLSDSALLKLAKSSQAIAEYVITDPAAFKLRKILVTNERVLIELSLAHPSSLMLASQALDNNRHQLGESLKQSLKDIALATADVLVLDIFDVLKEALTSEALAKQPLLPKQQTIINKLLSKQAELQKEVKDILLDEQLTSQEKQVCLEKLIQNFVDKTTSLPLIANGVRTKLDTAHNNAKALCTELVTQIETIDHFDVDHLDGQKLAEIVGNQRVLFADIERQIQPETHNAAELASLKNHFNDEVKYVKKIHNAAVIAAVQNDDIAEKTQRVQKIVSDISSQAQTILKLKCIIGQNEGLKLQMREAAEEQNRAIAQRDSVKSTEAFNKHDNAFNQLQKLTLTLTLESIDSLIQFLTKRLEQLNNNVADANVVQPIKIALEQRITGIKGVSAVLIDAQLFPDNPDVRREVLARIQLNDISMLCVELEICRDELLPQVSTQRNFANYFRVPAGISDNTRLQAAQMQAYNNALKLTSLPPGRFVSFINGVVIDALFASLTFNSNKEQAAKDFQQIFSYLLKHGKQAELLQSKAWQAVSPNYAIAQGENPTEVALATQQICEVLYQTTAMRGNKKQGNLELENPLLADPSVYVHGKEEFFAECLANNGATRFKIFAYLKRQRSKVTGQQLLLTIAKLSGIGAQGSDEQKKMVRSCVAYLNSRRDDKKQRPCEKVYKAIKAELESGQLSDAAITILSNPQLRAQLKLTVADVINILKNVKNRPDIFKELDKSFATDSRFYKKLPVDAIATYGTQLPADSLCLARMYIEQESKKSEYGNFLSRKVNFLISVVTDPSKHHIMFGNDPRGLNSLSGRAKFQALCYLIKNDKRLHNVVQPKKGFFSYGPQAEDGYSLLHATFVTWAAQHSYAQVNRGAGNTQSQSGADDVHRSSSTAGGSKLSTSTSRSSSSSVTSNHDAQLESFGEIFQRSAHTQYDPMLDTWGTLDFTDADTAAAATANYKKPLAPAQDLQQPSSPSPEGKSLAESQEQAGRTDIQKHTQHQADAQSDTQVAFDEKKEEDKDFVVAAAAKIDHNQSSSPTSDMGQGDGKTSTPESPTGTASSSSSVTPAHSRTSSFTSFKSQSDNTDNAAAADNELPTQDLQQPSLDESAVASQPHQQITLNALDLAGALKADTGQGRVRANSLPTSFAVTTNIGGSSAEPQEQLYSTDTQGHTQDFDKDHTDQYVLHHDDSGMSSSSDNEGEAWEEQVGEDGQSILAEALLKTDQQSDFTRASPHSGQPKSESRKRPHNTDSGVFVSDDDGDEKSIATVADQYQGNSSSAILNATTGAVRGGSSSVAANVGLMEEHPEQNGSDDVVDSIADVAGHGKAILESDTQQQTQRRLPLNRQLFPDSSDSERSTHSDTQLVRRRFSDGEIKSTPPQFSYNKLLQALLDLSNANNVALFDGDQGVSPNTADMRSIQHSLMASPIHARAGSGQRSVFASPVSKSAGGQQHSLMASPISAEAGGGRGSVFASPISNSAGGQQHSLMASPINVEAGGSQGPVVTSPIPSP